MNKVGRKTRYSPAIFQKAEKALANEGLTLRELSTELGVDRATIFVWLNKYREFNDLVKVSRKIAVAEIEDSLYKRATGYSTKEKKTIVEMDSNGKTKPLRIETLEKNVPADTTAMIFYLKNRDPENWRDRQNVELSGGINNPYGELTTEELRALATNWGKDEKKDDISD